MRNRNLYDAVIIGGGPAGLTAAICLAKARFRVLVVEKEHFGGRICQTTEVLNYPGIEIISGQDLTETMCRQARKFGAELLLDEVIDLDLNRKIKKIVVRKGEFNAFTVMIATGAYPRQAGFVGESEFIGRGVSYSAACDGVFFTEKELLVIGGGCDAVEESLYLTRYASKITILIRKDQFSYTKSITDDVLNHPKIKVLFNHELKAISGNESGITSAVIFNNNSSESFEYRASGDDTFGVFVFAGYLPNSFLVRDKVKLDESGYIIIDDSRMTNVPGVFAGGDVCFKSLRQVVATMADGTLASRGMEKIASYMRMALSLPPH